MSNVLKEEKRQQVLALGRLGWSLRQIEEATGVRRETASGYLKAAGLKVRGRGRPPARPAKPAIPPEMPTDSSPATAAGKGTAAAVPVPSQQPRRAPQASACEPYRELIVDALGRGRNAMAIWQDLVDDHGFPAGYTSVRRFVSTVRQQPALEARAVITTDRGEEAQVDYGEGPMVRDPDSGKYRRTRLFVLTLGYSRKAVRLLVQRSSAQVWAQLHERAFRRLGGTGVAPVPWTPILLARRRSPRCRSRDRRTRRHSDSRWSSWFGPDVHRESWLGSSSRRPRRYETGSRRLIATLASAPTACAPKNMKRFVGCAGRTGSCAKNAKFWQKPRPGSRGRPDPGGLPVHEHEPGSFSRRHDGPRARCLHERVLRVASTSTLSSGAG